MSHTTVAKVRQKSGFDNETNVTEATVRTKITLAEGMVDSAVGHRYALPISFHRQNTLTFAINATGAGTMAIVINGTTYNVVLESGTTPERAAELFRIAAVDSADFIVLLNGAVATIVSITDSSDIVTADTEVDITSAPTTQSMTATIGTRVDRYPQIIDEVTGEIAASYLLMDNYGAEAEDTPKDGEKRLGIALITLKQIQGSDPDDIIIDLFDEVTSVELPGGVQDTPGFLPNDTTKVDEDDPTAAKIGINDVY